MFARISKRNIDTMLGGTTLALILISGVCILALLSLKIGLIRLLPNLAPAVLAFGVWGIFAGQVNLARSSVIAMTLGIVVDDTVHFLSKYLRARRDPGLSAEDAARYAFSSVGRALIVTSIILVIGFSILSLSSFDLVGIMGRVTAMTTSSALIADLTVLPALLITVDNKNRSQLTPVENTPNA